MITILNLKEKFPTNGLIKDCLYKECKQYIKGQEGYNGLFVTENGKEADLRNQCWICKEHNKTKF